MDEIGRSDPNGIAIVEAALILEAGVGGRFDRLVVVTCHPEQRILRYARRMGISEDAARVEVNRRMAAQIPDEEKIKAADYVIDNSGTLDATGGRVQPESSLGTNQHLTFCDNVAYASFPVTAVRRKAPPPTGASSF